MQVLATLFLKTAGVSQISKMSLCTHCFLHCYFFVVFTLVFYSASNLGRIFVKIIRFSQNFHQLSKFAISWLFVMCQSFSAAESGFEVSKNRSST